MTHRTRKKTNSLIHTPQIYSGEDVMTKVMESATQSEFLSPGIYAGRSVGKVKMNTDPEAAVPYLVLAYVYELDEAIGEPDNYCIPDEEEYQSLAFYPPLTEDLQPPGPGEHIMLNIIEPKERVGFYVGKKGNFDAKNITGKSVCAVSKACSNNKPSDAFAKKKKRKKERKYDSVEKTHRPADNSKI